MFAQSWAYEKPFINLGISLRHFTLQVTTHSFLEHMLPPEEMIMMMSSGPILSIDIIII